MYPNNLRQSVAGGLEQVVENELANELMDSNYQANGNY
jgi:hypothetical protein